MFEWCVLCRGEIVNINVVKYINLMMLSMEVVVMNYSYNIEYKNPLKLVRN